MSRFLAICASWLCLLAVLIFFGPVSCGENHPPTDDHAAEAFRTNSAPSHVASRAGGADARSAEQASMGGAVPPANASWTIFCDRFQGPGHVELATRAKTELLNYPNLHNLYVVHRDDESELYYGYYADVMEKNARADKHAIDEIANSAGDRRFHSLFVPLNAPDPDAPPEWNLENTPANMFWSLQIGAYRGDIDRKAAAVRAVREARAAGVEAYYYHGETISSVCIGAWPKNAVRQQGESNVAKTADPDARILVSTQELPPNLSGQQYDSEGHPMTVFAPKLVIDDPTMKQACKDYPTHAVNGEVFERKDAKGKPYYTPSFLVQIPHREKLLETDNPDEINPRRAPIAAPPGVDSTDSSIGRLKTLDN